ncbi:hypothetical protein BN2476_190024 [Paraburkholderia piptadeniae]|uniref:Uncharacterized protein n=1 Tax=Paraburkholderia piptadeniae TaxID=1701573 RepID=A0A1N7RUM6_9BURK|nr:hypothetical protein BN2476_190024 [Paraburkholderia piptadeniae]
MRRHSVHNAGPWCVLGCIRGKLNGVVAYPPGCPLNLSALDVAWACVAAADMRLRPEAGGPSNGLP